MEITQKTPKKVRFLVFSRENGEKWSKIRVFCGSFFLNKPPKKCFAQNLEFYLLFWVYYQLLLTFVEQLKQKWTLANKNFKFGVAPKVGGQRKFFSWFLPKNAYFSRKPMKNHTKKAWRAYNLYIVITPRHALVKRNKKNDKIHKISVFFIFLKNKRKVCKN